MGNGKVFTQKLYRVREGRQIRYIFTDMDAPPPPGALPPRSAKPAAPPKPPEPPPPPARSQRVAFALALAHHIQQALDCGELRDRADAAKRLGIDKARVTQVLELTLLSPAIQEAILTGSGCPANLAESAVRKVAKNADWAVQRAMWAEIVSAGAPGRDHAPS